MNTQLSIMYVKWQIQFLQIFVRIFRFQIFILNMLARIVNVFKILLSNVVFFVGF